MSTFNRPPLNQGCNPQPGQGAPTAINDPCAILPQLRAGYYALLAGAQTQKIRFGDHEQWFQRGDAKTLKAEIDRLELLCSPRPSARAIRAGGYRGYGFAPRRFTSFY